MLVRKSDGTMVEVAELIQSPRAIATNLASDLAQNAGVVNLGNGQIVEQFPIPSSLSFTCASPDSGSSVTQYIFNTSDLNPLVTTNGVGTIVNTYGDGYSGKGYAQLFRSAKSGRGLLIKGFTIKATTVAGVLDSTFFTIANLNIIAANLRNGGILPVNCDLDMAVRNSSFKDGILTLAFPFYVNALTQLQYVQPKNSSTFWTFFTEASSFNG